MTPRGGTRVRATKKPVVVLAGEDSNDRRCLRIVLEAMCPQMKGRLVEINEPVRLRQATGQRLTDRVNKLARLARARAAREKAELACFFVHEDLDALDGEEYVRIRDRVQDALNREMNSAHYGLAAWETEAWMFLFPKALKAFVSSWEVPSKYLGRDTGKIHDPKKVLMNEIGNSSRRYRESDAPGVLEKAVSLGSLRELSGSNRSWSDLCVNVERCCGEHLGNR
ncbi:hypothetical protein FLX08_08945 [Microbispora hainanensis]|uniref:DUF4276 family protein n=1 Tax=Microbispora hainanensis TaxID=568844 RepID=A0A544YZ89_9ACTN|nr:hypothetical protein FLX08_08945 [Microbispora hainanensis]